MSASDMQAEEVKDTEAINESADAKISELTEDVKPNVALADEAAPEEHVIATKATVDIPQAQDPELEEIKNTEPVEVEENISESDLRAEEVKDAEAKKTEAINESTDANISELTEDVKSNVTRGDEAAPEELVTATEATVDIPRAQEPELEEIENVEPVEVEENTSVSDMPAEEVKDIEAKETDAINESSDANISELTEHMKSNVALIDEAAHEEHVTVAETTVDIPQAQEPELEEIKNTEAGDLSAEEVQEIEPKETEAISEMTDANIRELNEDVKSNVVLADEEPHAEQVTVAERTVDIPQTQEPELEEIKNTEPVEVEENRSARDLQAEEVRETEAINESPDANISELTEDVTSNVAPADEAAEHVIVTEATVDIPEAQEPKLEETKSTEPAEVEENISANDLPAEEVKDTEAVETEAINENTDANTSELTEDVKNNVALADEAAPEEHVTVADDTVDMPQAQEPEVEEMKNTEPVEVEENISASDLPAEEVKDTEAINESADANISELTEEVKCNVALADEEPQEEHVTVAETAVDIPQPQELELEEIKNTEPVEVEENISASDLLAEEVKDAEAKETEAINESTDANISELTEDVKSHDTRADEAAPEENVIAAEAAVDIPQTQVSELQELENVEPDKVEENRSEGDLPAEVVKEIETKETEAINESTDANVSELTGDVTSNVTPADEAAPEEHVTATEATVDIPRAQEPELEEIENVEPVEVEENTSASDMPAEEVRETEAINESTDANISELTGDMKSNVALIDEAAHEHVTVAETTVDIPQTQEPELEEIRYTEGGDLSAEEVMEIEPKETEAISGRTDANISELNEDVKSNVVLADEEPHAEQVTVAERTIDIPQAQEPELEEIKSTEPVEVEENRSASDLQAEEVKETEAINESPDANISELTEDVTSNVAPADEAAPEEHVIATEATVDIPPAQEPDLEESNNTEPVEVEGFISASDLPTEEVKETETKETEAINESTDANISELTEDVKGNIAHADDAAPEEHVIADEAAPEEHAIAAEATDDIPQAQVPELEELENTEPVEVEENKSATDLPAEEVKDTETKETEAVNKSADTNISELTEDVTLADEAAADIQIDVPPAKEPALEEMENIEPVEAQDGITSDNVPAEEINDTEAMETGEIPHESTDDSLTASAALPDIQQVPEQEAVEDKACTDTTENQGEPQQSIVSTSAELTPTEEETAVVEHTQDTHVQNAGSEPGSDPNLLVQSAHQSELAEDSKGQLVKAEETGQSNGATLEEPAADDNAANEIGPLADSKQERGLESAEENKCIDATEGEEGSHLSQDPGLEEPVSERDIATVEPTSDIQQVNDMDEAEEMAATEPINGEEISSQKTEVATLEDPSPTDNGTVPEQNPIELDEENLGNEISNAILADEDIKEEIQEPTEQKDESSDLGEKTAFTTQKDESATEEDVVQISGEDTVGTSNNIEQIKELPKSVIEHNAIKSGDHTDDQDDEQLHNVELQMQVCERSVDLTTEQPDDHVQKVNLDQQKKEDEAIEKQTEEIQTDEQKHDDSRADFTTETILEPQSNEIDTTNRKDNADVFEAEQTEAVTTEMLKNEQTLHIAQESIPSVTDVKVENSTEIEETIEQEDAPNNTGTLYTDADAEKYNEDEKENTEIDAAVAKTSTDEQDGTTDETINEEDPTVVPQNVESRVHSEEKECINANDGMQAIQASEEEIVDEVEKEEIQNEDTNVNHEEIETKLVDEEASGLQDLSFHPKVIDDKLATEQNGAQVETDSNEEMATGYTAVTESVKLGEAIYNKAGGPDVALSDENLAIEDNRRNLEASPAVTASGESMNEDNEHHKPDLPAHSAMDGNETEQASGLEVTERELFPEKPLPTGSEEQEESQITKEQDGENVQEQETDDTEKEEKEAEQSYLPVSHFLMNLIMGKESNEPDGNSEFKAEKKQEETTKDGSSLITSQQEESLGPIPTENKVDNERVFEQGKHNIEGSEETHDIKLEKDEELNRDTHGLEAPVCQNNVHGETSSEMVPGGSGLTTEMETRDIKLGEKATNSVCQEHMEATTQIEEGSLKLHDITSPKVSQEDTLEEGITDLQHEPLPENRSSDAVSGQTLLLTEPNMGDEKNLPNDTDDLQSPLSTKREESNESSITEAESTVEAELENGVDKEEKNQQTTTTGGVTEEQIENEHDISQKGTEAISDEQKGEITEPVMGNEINLIHEKGISAGSECKDEKQSSKFSNSELDNSEKALEIQLDGSSLHIDQDKQDESAGDQIVMEKNNLQDNPGESDLQKVQETEVAQESPEESDEGDQNSLPIREPVIKEVNVNKTVDNHVQTVDTQSQEEQETFNSQVQERDLDVASPEEAPEAEEKIVESKPEFSTDEEQSPKKDESNMAGEKTYDEKTKGAQEAKSLTDEAKTKVEEQGVVQKASHNQKRDLDVVSPTEAPGTEENVVDIKEPEFSTDEEQSPKKDVSNMAEEKSYEKKTNGDDEAKNFTDDAPTKIEEREAGQKASPKKHNILSGVGSKVKHQLAKVKKAIIGKPGHTKSELPKA
nr:extracellular matrix-binding protein ebh [Aegilops tauschii subsp. strangulata]